MQLLKCGSLLCKIGDSCCKIKALGTKWFINLAVLNAMTNDFTNLLDVVGAEIRVKSTNNKIIAEINAKFTTKKAV